MIYGFYFWKKPTFEKENVEILDEHCSVNFSGVKEPYPLQPFSDSTALEQNILFAFLGGWSYIVVWQDW